MAGEHTLDLVSLVGPENLLVTAERHALAPFDIQNLHVVAETLRHIDPKMAELAKARRKDLVTRREGIGQRRLPRARA